MVPSNLRLATPFGHEGFDHVPGFYVGEIFDRDAALLPGSALR